MNFRRLVRIFNRAKLSRHLHLQILAFGLATVSFASLVLVSLHIDHLKYQRDVDYTANLADKSHGLETAIVEQARLEVDYLSSRSGASLPALDKAAAQTAATIEDIRKAIHPADLKVLQLLNDFNSVRIEREEAFYSVVEERKKLGFGLETGLVATFLAKRASFRSEFRDLANSNIVNAAEDVMDSASDALSGYRLSDVLAFDVNLRKFDALLDAMPQRQPEAISRRERVKEFVAAFTDLSHSQDRVETLTKKLRKLAEDARVKHGALHEAFDNLETRSRDALEQATKSAAFWLWINLAFAVCVCTGVPYWIRKTVSQPLHEMAVAMERLSNGELDVTITRCRRRNELGKLSQAFFKFQRRLREVVGLSQALEAKHEELAKRQVFLELILSSSPVGVAVFNPSDEIVLNNDRYSMALFGEDNHIKRGWTQSEIWSELGRLNRATQVPLHRDVESGKLVGTSLYKFTDGRSCRILRQSAPDGSWVAIVEDVTDRVRMDEHVARLALYDALTELPNRAFFTGHLQRVLSEAEGEPVVVLFFDLDRFKTVNDTHGHAVGDVVLTRVGERLQSCLTSGEFVARLGGDEFAVFASGLKTDEEASALATRIIASLSEPYLIDGVRHTIGTSVGISVYPRDGSTSSDLLVKADLALYRSKNQGRGIHHFFAPDMVTQHQKMVAQERELREALVRGHFEVWYQPIYRLEDHTVSACEALLRWRHPVRGLVSPAEFIPLAERTGLIAPIGGWVLKKACFDAAQWPSKAKLSVNVSVVQLRSQNFITVVKAALAQSGLPPERLELEITESMTLAENSAIVQRLREIHALGVSIAMDDFGSGHSVLSSLEAFMFDKIKLDRSYVQGLGEKRKTAGALIRAVVAIAQDLQVESVAEGIETVEELAVLKSMGILHGQGYLLARPMPHGDLMQRLEVEARPKIADDVVDSFERALRDDEPPLGAEEAA